MDEEEEEEDEAAVEEEEDEEDEAVVEEEEEEKYYEESSRQEVSDELEESTGEAELSSTERMELCTVGPAATPTQVLKELITALFYLFAFLLPVSFLCFLPYTFFISFLLSFVGVVFLCHAFFF